MMDIVDKKTRSEMMSSIRSKNTLSEILIRKYLFSLGFRYRIHYKKLAGKPDIVLPKYRVVILVHGCFWHRHKNCKWSYLPKSNVDFWQSKFIKNIERDELQINLLISSGWRVIVIWECGLKSGLKDLSWLSNEIRAGFVRYTEWPKSTNGIL